MAAPLTQRQVRALHNNGRCSCRCAHPARSDALSLRKTLIKFFAFSVAILVVPVLLMYRGLEGAHADSAAR